MARWSVKPEPSLRHLIKTARDEWFSCITGGRRGRVVFGTDWPFDMDFGWPVSWILGLESITQEEQEALLWKNLEGLLGI